MQDKLQDQLIEKTDQLVKIKQVRDVYEKALTMEHTFKPETDPIDKAYMVKEIILRLGEGPDIQEMANQHLKN